VEELNASGERIGSLGSHDNFRLSVVKGGPDPQTGIEMVVVEADPRIVMDPQTGIEMVVVEAFQQTVMDPQTALETLVVEAYQAAPDTSTFDTLPPPFIYTKPEAEPAPVDWWAGTPSFETLPPDTSGGDWWAPVFADPAPVVAEVYVTPWDEPGYVETYVREVYVAPWDEPGYVETYVREDYVAPWDDVEPFVPAPVWGGWGDELASYR